MAVIIYSDDADKFALCLRAQIIRSMLYEREHQRTLSPPSCLLYAYRERLEFVM